MSDKDNSISNESFEMTLGDTLSFKEHNMSASTERRRSRRQHATPAHEVTSAADTEASAPTERKRTSAAAIEGETSESDKTTHQRRNVIKALSESRLTVFFGVVLLMVAAYTFLCALSFVANGNADQGLVEYNDFGAISERNAEVSNAGGPIGAMLSDFLVSRWLGLGSFVVIAYLVIISITMLRLKKCRFWKLTFNSLISAIAVSVIAGTFSFLSPHSWHWGGEHGYLVNEFLLKNTGVWGDVAVNIILFSAVVLIFFDTLSRAFLYIYNKSQAFLNTRVKYSENVDDDDDEDVAMTAGKEPEMEDTASKEKSPVVSTPVESEIPRHDDTFVPLEDIETVVTETAEEKDRPAAMRDLTLSDKSEMVISYSGNSGETNSKPAEMEISAPEIEVADKIKTSTFDPTAELSHYKLPPIELLRDLPQRAASIDVQEQELNKARITRTLNSYGIEIASITATVGPTITLYEIVPAEGVRIAKIKNLGNDMALSLSALGIRIIAPIPGKGTIGMEVPNRDKQIVSIRSILSSAAYQESKAALPIAMGTTIANEVYIADLAKMPHLLVAGATGMGKSVGLNTIIASLLYRKHPAELKFVLIDPKMVEFSLYSSLERHFLAKLPDEEEAIITDPAKALATLNSICVEMDNRYALLRQAGVREIKSYNEKFVERRLNPEKGHRYLPYIVVIVDEFADLITTAGKEVEAPISRIAAKARAVGIHMILATQRPSVDVITGVIKANFPGRMAFRVNQMNDSRTILDRPGADQLIGRGDMIISKDGVMERVQCALIETEEVEAICDFISDQIGYSSAYELPEYSPASESGAGSSLGAGERDALFPEAGHFVIQAGVGSTTALQRHFNIGFPRAGKIMDQLERAGVVGPSVGGKPRQVKMGDMDFEDYLRSIS